MTIPTTPAETPLWLEWEMFVRCLEVGLTKARRRLLRPHRLYLEEWHQTVIDQMRSADIRNALEVAWSAGQKPTGSRHWECSSRTGRRSGRAAGSEWYAIALILPPLPLY